ncbi:hypothetical protein SDC9_151837 [bioreactor metagenome]|uniref:Uncharacterized protein n=1 Tax=bioreactor metagenome TaxID=1076179 RepID=A0A645ERC2_9ZZZZ
MLTELFQLFAEHLLGVLIHGQIQARANCSASQSLGVMHQQVDKMRRFKCTAIGRKDQSLKFGPFIFFRIQPIQGPHLVQNPELALLRAIEMSQRIQPGRCLGQAGQQGAFCRT